MGQLGNKKTMTGVVVGNQMDKTVVVRVERHVFEKQYKKVIKRHQRVLAHDEQNEYRAGDQVMLEETRPLSKRKRWRVKSLVSRAPEA